MSAPGPSRVYHSQNVEDTSIIFEVSVRGPGGQVLQDPALQEQLMDKLKRQIVTHVPGAWKEDGTERGYGDSQTAPYPEPPPYRQEQHLPQGHPPHDAPDVHMSTPSPETVNREPGPSGSAAHSPETLIANLESQVLELTAKNEGLSILVNETVVEKEELAKKLQNAVKESEDLVQRQQKNASKIKRLNDMIIKNSQKSDEPLDEEMMQATFTIRNMATEIVNKHFLGGAKFHRDRANGLSDDFRRLYDPRLKINLPEGRRRLLRSLLYNELQYWFFGTSAKRFGVANETEKQLQRFERDIENSNKVDIEEALEWRTRTVSYARRMNFDCLDIINHVTHRIAAILSPMILPGADKHMNNDKKQVVLLENDIFELCRASSSLALRFRASKTKYEFKSFPDDTRQTAFEADPELVKPLDTEGPISKPLDLSKCFIFCTLWGALVKTRPGVSGEAGERAVLEKAQVILYERDLWGKTHDSHGTA